MEENTLTVEDSAELSQGSGLSGPQIQPQMHLGCLYWKRAVVRRPGNPPRMNWLNKGLTAISQEAKVKN